jgi:hypothetical protein
MNGKLKTTAMITEATTTIVAVVGFLLMLRDMLKVFTHVVNLR